MASPVLLLMLLLPPPLLLPQIVILVQVLAHELNHGYKYSVVPCETFNSSKVGYEGRAQGFSHVGVH